MLLSHHNNALTIVLNYCYYLCMYCMYLEFLSKRFCVLSGTIPRDIGNLNRSLGAINLGYNYLEGDNYFLSFVCIYSMYVCMYVHVFIHMYVIGFK
jgi:hypothetical protein